jgi:hypothetical protein
MADQQQGFPSGVWAFALNLDNKTTAEEFQQFLAERQVDFPLSHISVRNSHRGASVKISISDDIAVMLLNWVINGDSLKGAPVNLVKFDAEKGQRRRNR